MIFFRLDYTRCAMVPSSVDGSTERVCAMGVPSSVDGSTEQAVPKKMPRSETVKTKTGNPDAQQKRGNYLLLNDFLKPTHEKWAYEEDTNGPKPTEPKDKEDTNDPKPWSKPGQGWTGPPPGFEHKEPPKSLVLNTLNPQEQELDDEHDEPTAMTDPYTQIAADED